MFNRDQKPTIAIQNRSTVELGYGLSAMVDALQVHLDRDFEPVWGRGAKLVLVRREHRMPSGSWHLFIVDKTGEPGAEGYHDLTEDGFPVMYIDAKATLNAGDKIPVTICH